VLQLRLEHRAQRVGAILEPLEHRPLDAGAPQFEERRRGDLGQLGIDQEGKRWKEQAQSLDRVRARLVAEQRIDDGQLDRPGTDQAQRLGPAVAGDPGVAGGVEAAEPGLSRLAHRG
jgi:hypothetical protein